MADRGCVAARGEAGRRMTGARRIVAGEVAAGWTVSGKTVPCWDVASKSVPCTARHRMHGMKAATRVKAAASVKTSASVKTAGGAHAAGMEAASAGMEASTTYMKTATTGMKASTSAGMESAAAPMESAASAAMKAATATSVKAAASAATAARARLRQAGECEAGNSACEDCGYHQRSLLAGNAHVFLPCKTAVGKAGNATLPQERLCFKNSLV